MKRITSVLIALVLVGGLLAFPVTAEAKTGADKHYIEVDTANQQVRIYENLNDGTKKLIKKYICSTGKASTPTPAGTFKMGTYRQRFGYFVKWKCWAQYKMQFNGDILFHSILYSAQSESAVIQSSVNALGRAVSHGCVRLRVADAKWMWENCPAGTVVRVAKFTSDDANQQLGVVVDKVKLSYSKISLQTGKSFSLKAETTPKKASNNVTWFSSNTSVAKVDAKGKVTGVKPGTATITAQSNQNKSKKTSCIVTVTKDAVKLTKIEVNKKDVSLLPGGTSQIKASVSPEYATNKTLTYVSNDPNVATVSKAGLITAIKPGNAVITVKGDGASVKVNVTVQYLKPDGIELDKTQLNLTVGDSETLTAHFTPQYAAEGAVAWTSSDPSVATVSADGEVTAVGEGEAVITATSGKFKAQCAVKVAGRQIDDEDDGNG